MSPKGVYDRPDRSQSPHKKRIPIGSRDKLNFKQRDGFVRRVVYDRPDRSQSPHKKRIPIGSRDKLNFEQRDGFVRRVVNDVDGRVSMFEEAGYEQVRVPTEGAPLEAGDSSQLGSVVRKPVGGGVDGVLMEIPREFYDEDQAAKEARRLSKETSLLSEATELASNEGVRIKRPSAGVMIE